MRQKPRLLQLVQTGLGPQASWPLTSPATSVTCSHLVYKLLLQMWLTLDMSACVLALTVP